MRAYQTRARFAGELRRVEPPARVELASPRYKPGASPSMLRRQKLEPALGIEPKSHAYRARALPLSYAGWRPVRDSNPLLDVTNVAHRHQCVPALERVTGVEPVSHCMASSDPSRWTTLAEMERVARVELASLVWKTRAPAAIPYPLGRGGGTCTRLKWLMRPCWNYLQSTPQNGIQLSKIWSGRLDLNQRISCARCRRLSTCPHPDGGTPRSQTESRLLPK